MRILSSLLLTYVFNSCKLAPSYSHPQSEDTPFYIDGGAFSNRRDTASVTEMAVACFKCLIICLQIRHGVADARAFLDASAG
jgi:hypothetical protein